MLAGIPTIVLVHGAWADATGFDAELRALQARGFRAIGFANPLRDLAGDAAYLAEFLTEPDRPDRAGGPLLRRQRDLDGRGRQRPGPGAGLLQRLAVRPGRAPTAAPGALRRQPGRASIRPVPFTAPDGTQGTDLFWPPRGSVRPSPPPWMPSGPRCWPRPSGPMPRRRSRRCRGVRRRGRGCRAGLCWALRTGRSRRRCSGSWPNARTRGSWRWRPPRSRSCPSPRPRPSSSSRPSRPPPQPDPDQATPVPAGPPVTGVEPRDRCWSGSGSHLQHLICRQIGVPGSGTASCHRGHGIAVKATPKAARA
jgi:hypothetical protein